MKENKTTINRRNFLQSTALAAGAFAIAPLQTACTTTCKEEVNRSNFGGVKIGAITYSYRSLPTDAGSVLLYSLASGLGSLEMMGDVAENYAGRPKAPQFGPQIRPVPGQQLTPEQQKEREAMAEARQKYNDELTAWRISVPMAKFEELGKLYKMAGIDIHIVKLDLRANMSDAEIDYVFKASAATGAMGVTAELSLELAERAAPFAAKHGQYLIFHNHAQFGQENFEGYDPYLKYDAVRFNFDMGHYFGSTGKDPREIVEKYHDRIASFHIKDKTGPTATPRDTNRPLGQGDTPLKEFLLYIQSNAGKPGWPVNCDIELEYDIPENSDAVKETAKCVEWTKNVLVK
jgi:hypothetical protein